MKSLRVFLLLPPAGGEGGGGGGETALKAPSPYSSPPGGEDIIYIARKPPDIRLERVRNGQGNHTQKSFKRAAEDKARQEGRIHQRLLRYPSCRSCQIPEEGPLSRRHAHSGHEQRLVREVDKGGSAANSPREGTGRGPLSPRVRRLRSAVQRKHAVEA